MSELMTTKLSDVKAEPVSWLWPGRIPRGKVTLIAGDPGLGKSFLTMDIAARVTRAGSPGAGRGGGDWPDGPTPLRAPGEVVILNAEDDAADTLRPRLEAAGADVSRVRFVEGIDRDDEPSQGYFALDRDCAALGHCLRRLTSPRLVIIDPISAFMGAVDSHRNTDVRAVLARLGAIAAGLNVAVLCVTHLSKSGEGQSKKAVHRLMGSLAFAAAARMVWMVGVHPDDPDRRVLSLVKSNLQATRTGLSYTIRTPNASTGASGAEHAAGGGGGATVVWDEQPFSGTADALEDHDLAERESAIEEAERFLRELLAQGPVSAVEAMRQAETVGLSDATIRRARRKAGVVVRRVSGPDTGGSNRPWVWSLSGGEVTKGS